MAVATSIEADPPSDADIEQLARAVRHRVLRWLRKRGVLPTDDSPTHTADEPSPLAALAAASVQGKVALGRHAGAHAPRLGRGSATGGEFRRGKLCAESDGFSLHAAVRIPELCNERLEKLCRYAARPPLVHERLSLSKDGNMVIYQLKRRYRDGSTHVVLDPLDFIERLAPTGNASTSPCPSGAWFVARSCRRTKTPANSVAGASS